MDNEEKRELLPCPFCGGEAAIREKRYEGTGASGMETPEPRAVCKAGCIKMRPVPCDETPYGQNKGSPTYKQARAQAIAAWNRRASPPSATAPPHPARFPSETDCWKAAYDAIVYHSPARSSWLSTHEGIAVRAVRSLCLAGAQPPKTFDKLGADRLADEVAVLIARKVIDSRSPAGDALLDYRDPQPMHSPRAERIADLERELESLRGLAGREAGAGSDGEIRVVFDGPPAHESGRFVEVELPDGRSINAGEWFARPDKLWELRIPRTIQVAAPVPAPAGERDATIEECAQIARREREQWESTIHDNPQMADIARTAMEARARAARDIEDDIRSLKSQPAAPEDAESDA